MITKNSKRLPGIVALAVFFFAGSFISFTAGLSLLMPGDFLEPLWRLNPRGHDGLVRIGLWAVLLLFTASASCLVAAIGLWRGARWGHKIALVLIAVNLLSDILNAVSGNEPRTIIGVPVALAIMIYLMSGRVKRYFTAARTVQER